MIGNRKLMYVTEKLVASGTHFLAPTLAFKFEKQQKMSQPLPEVGSMNPTFTKYRAYTVQYGS